jgi:hypothetical protein
LSCAWITSSCFSALASSAPRASPRASKRSHILPLGLGLPYRLGAGIALRAQAIRLDLRRLALLFQRRKIGDIEHEAAPRQLAAATPDKSLRSSFGSSTMNSLLPVPPKQDVAHRFIVGAQPRHR